MNSLCSHREGTETCVVQKKFYTNFGAFFQRPIWTKLCTVFCIPFTSFAQKGFLIQMYRFTINAVAVV